MYIKHMKLICSTEKNEIQGIAFIDLKPFRIYGTKEAILRKLNQYRWHIGLSKSQKLLKTFQSVKIQNAQGQESVCKDCPQRVICLVSAHVGNIQWPEEVCPFIKADSRSVKDNKISSQKVVCDKLSFIMEHKCDLCSSNICFSMNSMITRMLCTDFVG